MVKYKDTADKLHVAELDLDSVTQSIHKTPNLPPKAKRWLKQLHRALGMIRSLQRQFPQKNYTLTRCRNVDELPWQKEKWLNETGSPRSKARINWHAYKKEREAQKRQVRLVRREEEESPSFTRT